MLHHFEGFTEKLMFPLMPAYIMTIASTVAFDVDIKTIVAVVSLVLAQLWMGIRWGMKVESTQTELRMKLQNIEGKLEGWDAAKLDDMREEIMRIVKIGVEEAINVKDRSVSHNPFETIRRV